MENMMSLKYSVDPATLPSPFMQMLQLMCNLKLLGSGKFLSY